MANVLDDFSKRLSGAKESVSAATNNNDETVPERLRFLFYGAMLVMAWRTADFLWITMPQNIFGYPLMVLTLACLEGGALIWHYVHSEKARDYIASEGAKPDSAQFTISMIAFAIDFCFSIVTTIADISHVTGLQEWNLPALQPITMLASGLIVIANAFLFLQYDDKSPEKRAARLRANDDAVLKQRKAQQERELEVERAEIDGLAQVIAQREGLARQAQDLAERELVLANKAKQLQAVRDQTRGAETRGERALAMPAPIVSAEGNGNEPRPLVK
jgi:hypothetical protein